MPRTIDPVFISAAQAVQTKYGIPASVTLAQWALESAYGEKNMGCHNYFGMKFTPKRHKKYVERRTREVVNDKEVFINAKFAAFDTVEDAFDDRARLLANNSRYAPAMAVKDDPNKFAEQLQACGYATDPVYADLLKKIMRLNNFYQYDLKQEQSNA
ncbi:MAG: glucosaminidase domain-containing protein [Acidobacteriota bacterium]